MNDSTATLDAQLAEIAALHSHPEPYLAALPLSPLSLTDAGHAAYARAAFMAYAEARRLEPEDWLSLVLFIGGVIRDRQAAATADGAAPPRLASA